MNDSTAAPMQGHRPIVQWYVIFGLMGALPFVFSSWATLAGYSVSGLAGEVVLHSYAVAITAFMAGTLWGGTFTTARFSSALLGMAAALGVAFTVWMPTPEAFLTLAFLLTTLWVYDILRYYRFGLPSWYLGLRCTLSTVAILSLLLPVFLH